MSLSLEGSVLLAAAFGVLSFVLALLLFPLATILSWRCPRGRERVIPVCARIWILSFLCFAPTVPGCAGRYLLSDLQTLHAMQDCESIISGIEAWRERYGQYPHSLEVAGLGNQGPHKVTYHGRDGSFSLDLGDGGHFSGWSYCSLTKTWTSYD